MFRRAVNFLSDYLFPVFCVDCGSEGDWLCNKCKRRIKIRPFIFYPPQIKISRGVFAFFPYSTDSIYGRLIRFWKYNSARGIEREWGRCVDESHLFLSRYFNGFDKGRSICLVPVPLHSRRERERGFNQAIELAKILVDNLKSWGYDAVLVDCLKRVRYTSQQAKLSPSERRQNLKQAFVLKDKQAILDQVVLVDDVFTTGSTMQECAEVMRLFGVEKIGAVVLAHG